MGWRWGDMCKESVESFKCGRGKGKAVLSEGRIHPSHSTDREQRWDRTAQLEQL